jgi:hypothetical protein
MPLLLAIHALQPHLGTFPSHSCACLSRACRDMEWTAPALHFTPGPTSNMTSIMRLLLHATWQFALCASSHGAFLCLSAYSRARALTCFHALMHFAPDCTHTAYHGSHIRVFLMHSCTTRCIPSLLGAFPRIATHSCACARLARLSCAYQLVPALAHLHVFMRSRISRLITPTPHIMIRISESSQCLPT